jgi:hypothetical protein
MKFEGRFTEEIRRAVQDIPKHGQITIEAAPILGSRRGVPCDEKRLERLIGRANQDALESGANLSQACEEIGVYCDRASETLLGDTVQAGSLHFHESEYPILSVSIRRYRHHFRERIQGLRRIPLIIRDIVQRGLPQVS